MTRQQKKWTQLQMHIMDVLRLLLQAAKTLQLDTCVTTGNHICRFIIQRYLKYLYRSISSGSNPVVHCALWLLETIASFSTLSNVEMHKHFYFGMKVGDSLT